MILNPHINLDKILTDLNKRSFKAVFYLAYPLHTGDRFTIVDISRVRILFNIFSEIAFKK